MKKLIIASNNKGKIAEYKKLLEPFDYEVISMRDAGVNIDIEETETTFEGNSALKANAIYDIMHCAVLADDSGLEVDYLDGKPGVYSARYGGEGLDDKGRSALVLNKLEGVPFEKRTARFVCVIHFIDVDATHIAVRGECEGHIGTEPVGENGFGYDPIFMFNGKSFAQISDTDKNEVSHRANALKKLVLKLNERQ